eukprot:scaffold1756_cov183-Pinguiococcus_pyrenoidosus.AAC.2
MAHCAGKENVDVATERTRQADEELNAQLIHASRGRASQVGLGAKSCTCAARFGAMRAAELPDEGCY